MQFFAIHGRMIDLSYGITMWAEVSFVLSQLSVSQTDGQTIRSWMQRGENPVFVICVIRESQIKSKCKKNTTKRLD